MGETIYALATAPGRAALAVVRLSGPDAGTAVAKLTGRRPRQRGFRLQRIVDPDTGQAIDQALVLWFAAPQSFTGDDVAEFHLHGGMGIIQAMIGALSRLGLRAAEPGEFTRRAFENGKLDLCQAEAIADLVDADSPAQLEQALGQFGGALSVRYETWRHWLLESLAYLEAAVDFPDEELPSDVARKALPNLVRLRTELEAGLADAVRGERTRDGYRIAIVGPPNAGKSSLFNALLKRDAAIVTPIAGTTRDVIEATWILAGYSVVLADTAGQRDSDDPIEQEGVRRAKAWAASAALRLQVVAADQAPVPSGTTDADTLPVVTKADLVSPDRVHGLLAVSVQTGEGLATLRDAIRERVIADQSGMDFPAVTRARHREALAEGLTHVRRALAVSGGPELMAEDVRLAARALARVTGVIGTEAVLGEIFGRFCIGK